MGSPTDDGPLNRSVSKLAAETGINVEPIYSWYSWHKKARESGVVMPSNA